MTRFEPGDVVLVPFPFTDQSATKKRPAVVISSKAYNTERPDLVIMAVTSQLKSTPILGEVIVQDWQAAGLLKPSAVRGVVATVDKSEVIRKLGVLSARDFAVIEQALAGILGLQVP